MASGISEFGLSRWLQVLFGLAAPPDGYFVAVCIDEPGEATDGDSLATIEPADAAYVRQWVPTGSAHWDEDAGWLVSVTDVVFPRAVADWGLLTHYVLLDDSTPANIYGWGEIDDAPSIAAGQRLTLPAGGIVVGSASVADSIAV